MPADPYGISDFNTELDMLCDKAGEGGASLEEIVDALESKIAELSEADEEAGEDADDTETTAADDEPDEPV